MEIFFTNKKIKVIIADDSPFVRGMLKAALEADPEIGIIGMANNGREAVELAERLKPSIITMDVQMPEMDGLEATRQIMIDNPCPILVITSVMPQELVKDSFDILSAGAVDIIQKPYKDKDVIHKVKLLAEVKMVSRRLSHRLPSKEFLTEMNDLSTRIEKAKQIIDPKIIGIASSTGGPHALLELLSRLPDNFPVPILIVQHMTDGFMPGLVSWLGEHCQLKIKEAICGENILPGYVYLAPNRYHTLITKDNTILLKNTEPVNGHKPSANPLLQSIAKHFGKKSIGIILTGMGEDGVAGLEAIKKQGGYIIAQDEASCVVFGMPRAAIAKGVVDYIEPISTMAQRLVELCIS